jgi:hypothetical protein
LATAPETIVIRITPSFYDDVDSLQLRFPPEYSDEILALLDEHGIAHNTGAEFHANPTDWIEILTGLGGAGAASGGLLGVAAVIRAVAHRHDGRRVVVKHDEVEVSGFSTKDTEQLLKDAAKQQKNLNAQWSKMKRD